MGQEKHFAFSRLALSNLVRRPFRTAALMFLVSVLSFALFAGSLITLSLRNGTDELSKRLGADLLVVPRGYEQRTKGILLGGEPSTFYMDAAWARKIASVKGVRSASPQLYVASLSADCCSSVVQIVGFDQSTDFTVGPWIKSARPGPLSIDEIVIGGAVNGTAGGTLKFLGRNYKVAAKLDRSGTGFDTSVFMNFEAAQRAAEDYVKKTGGVKVPPNAVSSVTVQVQNGYSAADVEENISDSAATESQKISVISAEQFVGSLSGSLRSTIGFSVALAALLWVLAVLVLGIVFSVILRERRHEFGLLRSLGATKKRLASLVLLEAGGISLNGGLLGIGFCALLILPFRVFIQHTLNMPYLQPPAPQFAALAGVSLLISFAVGPVSSLVSVLKICRGDISSVIREGDL